MLQNTTNNIVNKLAIRDLDMNGRRTIRAADAKNLQDYITLNDLQTRLAPSAYTDTTDASNITEGTLPSTQLPTPTNKTLGGIKSIAKVATKFIQWIDTFGNPQLAQPAFSDLSGSIAVGQLPAGVLVFRNQAVVTGSRALGTNYQNTNPGTMFVTALSSLSSSSGAASTISAYTDATPTPSTLVTQGFLNNGGTTFGITMNYMVNFMVLPGNYYRVAATGSFTGLIWTEWW